MRKQNLGESAYAEYEYPGHKKKRFYRAMAIIDTETVRNLS